MRPVLHEERQHHRADTAGHEVGVVDQVAERFDGAAVEVPRRAVEELVEGVGDEVEPLVDFREALPEQALGRTAVEGGVELPAGPVNGPASAIRADIQHQLVGEIIYRAAVQVHGSHGEVDVPGQQLRRKREGPGVVPEGAAQEAVFFGTRRSRGRRRHRRADRDGEGGVHAGATSRRSGERRSRISAKGTASATRPAMPAHGTP